MPRHRTASPHIGEWSRPPAHNQTTNRNHEPGSNHRALDTAHSLMDAYMGGCWCLAGVWCVSAERVLWIRAGPGRACFRMATAADRSRSG